MSSLWRGGEHGELASRGMNVMMPMGGRGSRQALRFLFWISHHQKIRMADTVHVSTGNWCCIVDKNFHLRLLWLTPSVTTEKDAYTRHLCVEMPKPG